MTNEPSNVPDGFQCGTGRKSEKIAKAMSGPCRCEACETTRRVRAIAAALGSEDGDFVRELWLRALTAEMDLENARAKEQEAESPDRQMMEFLAFSKCQYCGNESDIGGEELDGRTSYLCANCGQSGPWCDTEAEAREAWNLQNGGAK